MSRFTTTVVALCLGVGLTAGSAGAVAGAKHPQAPVATTGPHAAPIVTSTALPPARHVFVINIENKTFAKVWGPTSGAPYLATTLRAKGVLLTGYHGTAHHSLGNYTAQISGQGVSRAQQADCDVFASWAGSGVAAFGQYVGNGCVFP